MELTTSQRRELARRAADQAAYAAYAKKCNAQSDAMNADRNRRYLRLRIGGMSVDDAYDALLSQLSAECGSRMVQISGLDAYADEYQCGESLEEVIAMRAPEMLRE